MRGTRVSRIFVFGARDHVRRGRRHAPPSPSFGRRDADARARITVPPSCARDFEVIGFLCFFAVEIGPFGDRAGARRT
jgi:hypothetical protein